MTQHLIACSTRSEINRSLPNRTGRELPHVSEPFPVTRRHQRRVALVLANKCPDLTFGHRGTRDVAHRHPALDRPRHGRAGHVVRGLDSLEEKRPAPLSRPGRWANDCTRVDYMNTVAHSSR